MIEEAIKQFRQELRDAVLTKKIDVEYRILSDEVYQFQITVRIDINEKVAKAIIFSVSESNGFICYHEPMTEGIFDNDITKLSNLATFGCTRLEYEWVPHNGSRTTFQTKCKHRDTCKMWHNCMYNRDRLLQSST